MELRSLGYVGIQARSLEDWRGFGAGLVGLQPIDRTTATLAFRMDERDQRLFVEQGPAEAPHVFGWEVDDASALDRLAARLEAAGVRVTREPAALADQRLVAGLIAFPDPIGNRLEAFHGPHLASGPFQPGRAISGFRTGALGLGHVVLTVERADNVIPFYRDILGFRPSDHALEPFRAFFFHLNARHHSFAVVETGRNGFHHLMVELCGLDDVGQAYDLAQGRENGVGVTLGRHTNDYMTSFYARSPSNFMVECGWGGRSIDPGAWTPVELEFGPSLWGHDRAWLTPEVRAQAREMRLAGAAAGLRAPVQVMTGNHVLADDRCVWPTDAPRSGRS